MAWGGRGSPFTEMENSEQSGKVSEIPKCEWIAKRLVGELPLRLGHRLTRSRMFMKHFMWRSMQLLEFGISIVTVQGLVRIWVIG